MDFAGKNVVYVGGFGGIGCATCNILLTKNIANLVILDIKEDTTIMKEFKNINPATKVTFMQLDLCDKKQIVKVIKDVIASLKFIDILVNGSGVIDELDPDVAISINLLGLIHTTMNVIPHMDKTNGGRGGLIVNIASVAGLDPAPNIIIYTASKHGVVGFSRSLSDNYYYERTGIAVITICPGLTTSNMYLNAGEKYTFPYSVEVVKPYHGIKIQSPDECANSLVKAVETGKNGSIWILDVGELTEVHSTTYWKPKF